MSSQVGCALDCTFCATAKLGFGRQLTAGEIVDQVYRAQDIVAALAEDDPTRRAGADRVTNLVFMGMGEPLHNFKNVMRALDILTDPIGRRLLAPPHHGVDGGPGARHREAGGRDAHALRVNLAVSLNATTDEVRDVLMPINKKWNIARLLEAVRKFPLEKRRRVTFEYVLLDGVNDTHRGRGAAAQAVARHPVQGELDPVEPARAAAHPYRRPTDERVRAFQEALKARGLAVYVRRSRGDDIDAACGQLAAKAAPPGQPAAGSYLYVHRKLARRAPTPLSLEHAEDPCRRVSVGGRPGAPDARRRGTSQKSIPSLADKVDTVEHVRPKINHVLIISEDGLRADAVGDAAPASGTTSCASAAPIAITRSPSATPRRCRHTPRCCRACEPKTHGLTWNTWRPREGYIKSPTIFTHAQERG